MVHETLPHRLPRRSTRCLPTPPETLHLTVNLLDRYCSRRVVYKRHYQLVGCAALLIAAKYGDRKERVPLIRELKSMCCSLYDEEMFTQMEWHVLNTLDWTIGHPAVDTWLQLALKDGPACEDVEVEHMALYLCEIALYHKDFVQIKSSVMARASLALARGILGRPDNTDTHGHLENLTLLNLSNKLERPSQVLYRKYASPHMSRASASLEHFLQQQQLLQRRAAPPTPPCEPAMHKPASTIDMFPGTPQKQPFGTMVNGYMTPPITPEGEYFQGGNEVKGYHQAPRCPVTPTPTHNNPYIQQQVAIPSISTRHDHALICASSLASSIRRRRNIDRSCRINRKLLQHQNTTNSHMYHNLYQLCERPLPKNEKIPHLFLCGISDFLSAHRTSFLVIKSALATCFFSPVILFC